MATATLTPYYSSAAQQTFTLASQGSDKVTWRDPAASRSLARPYIVELTRKLGQQNSKANDHVTLKISRSESAVSTGLPVTGFVSLDISIPRDNTSISAANMQSMLGILGSLLFNSTATPATLTNIASLVNGSDL